MQWAPLPRVGVPFFSHLSRSALSPLVRVLLIETSGLYRFFQVPRSPMELFVDRPLLGFLVLFRQAYGARLPRGRHCFPSPFPLWPSGFRPLGGPLLFLFFFQVPFPLPSDPLSVRPSLLSSCKSSSHNAVLFNLGSRNSSWSLTGSWRSERPIPTSPRALTYLLFRTASARLT